MKNLKISALLVLTVVLVFAMGTQAFAIDLPSATVTEVTGADLTVTLTDGSAFGALPGGTYKMAKAVTFSTNYTDDALKASDLEYFGDWLCDFKITLSTLRHTGIDGDSIILVGNYAPYGSIGFHASDFAATFADGSYDILATTGLDYKLTYSEVVNSVGTFTCGIVDVDNKIPADTKISVQLVMYEDRAKTIVHNIGEPVVYSKATKGLPHIKISEVKGNDLTVDLEDGSAFGGLNGGTVKMDEAIKLDAIYTNEDDKARELAKYGNWLCDFTVTVTSPDGNGLDADKVTFVGNYDPYGNIGFKASDFAATLADGSFDMLAATGLDDKLTFNEVVNSVGSFTCGISEDGIPVGSKISVQFVMYEDAAKTIAHNVGDPVVYEKYNVKITGKDAYVDDNGEGNLRFITTVRSDEEVYYYGTWIVPENYFDTDWTNAADLWDDDEVKKGDSYTADIYGIPASYLAKTFYAMSYIGAENEEYVSNIETAVIDDIKNFTSN